VNTHKTNTGKEIIILKFENESLAKYLRISLELQIAANII
jgi:hypothetical protein